MEASEGVLGATTAAELQVDRPARLRIPWQRVWAFGPYAGAAVSYVAIGVFFTPFMQFWAIAFAWLLLWTWILPALVRRIRR